MIEKKKCKDCEWGNTDNGRISCPLRGIIGTTPESFWCGVRSQWEKDKRKWGKLLNAVHMQIRRARELEEKIDSMHENYIPRILWNIAVEDVANKEFMLEELGRDLAKLRKKYLKMKARVEKLEKYADYQDTEA